MNVQQNNIDVDHQWKGQDHLQPLPEHLPSSTSCSHRPAPWWMMLVVVRDDGEVWRRQGMVMMRVKDEDGRGFKNPTVGF